MALIITFNVNPSRVAALVEAVKALGEWGALTPTSYLITTNTCPGEIMERLHGFVAPDEELWAITAAAPWASYGNAEVEDHAELLGAPDDWTVWDWDAASSTRPRVVSVDT
jgi:hypothetical protein